MSPEQFREYGHQVVDWVADYLAGVGTYPVGAQVSPGEVRAALPAHPPEHGEPFAAVLADLQRVILPGVTHWQHPSYFAYFPANASGPAILGDLLSSGLGVQGMLWATSPACTELEMVVTDWLAELLGLPEAFRHDSAGGGVIEDSASSANLVALLAARHRASTAGGEHTVYVTGETHSSMEKAVRIAGIGADQLRVVDVGADLAMDPASLQRLLTADIAAGATPTMVCATVGTTGTGAVDPVRSIGEICAAHGIWLHVDAAYAGVATVCPDHRHLIDGVAEYADSYCTDPHKWLLTNFDCTALWVGDEAALTGALSIVPEYLRNRATESGAVVDYRDWQVPLGRRFRALKLWSVIRWYGAAGLRAHIEHGVELAGRLAAAVRADERFELVTEPLLGLVCLRPRWEQLVGVPDGDGNELTELVLRRLNESGELFLSHASVDDRMVLRFCIGSPQTQWPHVEAAWRAIGTAVTEVATTRSPA
ncbi:MAG: aminotransferase class V-fold PLP-dependent enzyme [Streptosporangiales bacterium]|nr:aminotransferase class V-fold PLP-dependent enzyme [Streptosporangiales bacterium]